MPLDLVFLFLHIYLEISAELCESTLANLVVVLYVLVYAVLLEKLVVSMFGDLYIPLLFLVSDASLFLLSSLCVIGSSVCGILLDVFLFPKWIGSSSLVLVSFLYIYVVSI